MDNPTFYCPAPEFQRVLSDLEQLGNPLDTMTAENISDLRGLREVTATKVLETIPMASVHDMVASAGAHRVPVRIYTPQESPPSGGRLPMLVYYHGGGWTIGSLGTYDSLCRGLARFLPAIVISVAYRLAPEHPYPAAVQDAKLALEWVARRAAEFGGEPGRLAVGGDSAGGNLATIVAAHAKKEGIGINLQVLFYPGVDLSRMDRPSHLQYGVGYGLTNVAMETFRRFYVPNPDDWRRPDVSPLLASDEDLRQLPPAVIMTAGCDPLLDEGEAYAERLASLGVPVVYRLEADMIHAWLGLFNNFYYPEVSRFVEPRLEELARVIREAWVS